jgi:hypothetical protein
LVQHGQTGVQPGSQLVGESEEARLAMAWNGSSAIVSVLCCLIYVASDSERVLDRLAPAGAYLTQRLPFRRRQYPAS